MEGGAVPGWLLAARRAVCPLGSKAFSVPLGTCGQIVTHALCSRLTDVEPSADRGGPREPGPPRVARRTPRLPAPAAGLQQPSRYRARHPMRLRTSDDHHKELVGADQRDRRPLGYRRADRPVSQPVSNVGRQRCRDAQAEEPPRQRGNRCLPARRTKHHHRTRVNQPVHRQRDQAARPAHFTMRPHESVSMLIRRHRSNTEYCARSGPPDDPIGRRHRAPPKTNTVVKMISLACAIGRPWASDTNP
jgi:hypothetical protein